MATEYDQYIDQGSTFINSITVNGSDLSAATIKAQMRKSYTAQEYTDFIIIPTDLINGHFDISLDSITTGNLKSGRYVYDVKYKIDTTEIRVLQGIVTVYPGVTR